jgi:hypothetical protein
MANIAQTTDFRVRKGLVVENTATILSTIGTTGTNSGALQVVGGVGIGGNLFVGGVITATTYYGVFAGSFAGTINTATNLGAGVANQIPYQSAPGATSYSSNLVFNGTTFTTTNITITGVTGTIGTNTGALQVVGGVGVAGNLFVGGTITATNLVLTGNETEAGVLSITNVTGTTGTNTGALQVVGGVGVAGGMFVGGTVTSTNHIVTGVTSATSTQTGAFQIAGGVGIGGNLFVAGSTIGDGGSNNGSGSLVRIQQNTSWSGAQPWALYVSGYSYLNGFRINGGDGPRALFLQSGQLGFASGDTASPITFSTQNTSERLRIDTSGTVYINTTTQYSGAIFNVVGGAYITGAVTATTFIGNLTGTAVTATNANNIIGGAAGSIPIQSAAGTTAFIPLGNAGYVLTVSGTTATWQAVSGLSAGTATNANNVLTQAQSASATYYPTFVNANNNVAAYVSEFTTSSFSINPATGALTVGPLYVNNSVYAQSTLTSMVNSGTGGGNGVAGGILSSTGLIWNSGTGVQTMNAYMQVNGYSNNVATPVSKLSFYVGSNSAAATEQMYVTSQGLFYIGGGGIHAGTTLNDATNSLRIQNNAAATSGGSGWQASNKLFLQGTSWNSAQGSNLTNGSIQAITLVNNANPTTEAIVFAPASGNVNVTATNYFAMTNQARFGIGTTTPVGQLDVVNTATSQLLFSVSNTGTINVNASTVASKVDGVTGWTWESVATLGTANTDITFKPDGTKMFMVGSSIQQWTLSPAWTLVGASAGTSYSLAAIDTGAQGLTFSPDGTKMVTVGDTAVANATVSSLAGEDRAYYFTLSTPWDPSSATLVSSIRFATADQGLPAAESNPAGCAYSTDGTSFYMVGNNGDKVYQYILSTPFVVSAASATYSKQLSIVNEDPAATGISFNYTGTRMYFIGQQYDQVFEYRLSTAWDIATAVFYDKYFVGTQNGSMIGLYVNDTSTNYTYLASSTGVYRYTATSQATVITAETTNSGIVLYGNTRIKGGPNNNLVVDQNIYTFGTTGITMYNPTITAGQSGASSNIFIGISTGGMNLYTGQSSGAFILGGGAATGSLTLGRSTAANTVNLSNGATTAAFLKVVNIATGGLAGSTSTVNIGPALGTGTVTVNAGAVVYIANVNNAVSTSTGALQVAGGVGIGGGLVVGGTITATNAIVSGSIAITGNITATIITATTSNIIGNATVGGSVAVTGNISAVTVTATTFVGALTGTASSANNLTGGAAGSIPIQSAAGTTAYIPIGSGGQILTASGSTATWTSLSGLSAGTASTATNLAGGTSGQIPYQANPGSTGFIAIGTAGQLLLSNGTSAPSFSNSIPSLTVSNATSATSTNSGALQVVGGVGIGGGLFVGGNAQIQGATTFAGPVTFSGTATYVLSTNTFYTDNLLEIHVPQGGVNSLWNADDGKDIGFRFHYYNRTLSTDSNAALILANDSQTLEWYGTGAESTTSIFTSATYGVFKTGSIKLVGGAGTNNATSGDLQVTGGVGIGGGLYVGGTLTATIHTSPTSLTFNVNNNSTAILVDANRNLLLGGATSVLNGVNAGAVVQLGDAGSSQSTLLNPWLFFNGKYSTAGGVPQYGGIWASSNYWGIGPDTNAADNTVRIGTMTGGATGYQWNATSANLKIGTLVATGAQVNGIVTATTFYGTFIGTLTTIASTANTIVTQVSNVNALYYPTFVSILNTATNIGVVEYTTSSFTVNPSTGQVNIGSTSTATMNALLGVNGNAYVNGILTATNVFVGPWPVNTSTFSGNAGLANTATTVIVQASNTTANYYPSFVSRNNLNTTTSETLFTTGSFFINATSGVVTLGSTTVTNNEIILGITNASSTLTGALQVKGGAGIGGNVYAGGDIYTRGTQVIPLNIQEFVATGAQTTFTPIGGYTVGTVQVFANGINLGSGDFTASNGSTVVLSIPRNASDIIRIISGGTSSSVNNIKNFSIAMSVAMAM